MLLESGKIYKRKYFRDSYLCPTLQIVGSAKVFMSNESTKPSSTAKMLELKDIKNDSLNVITGMTRWIAVTYDAESDDSNAVFEMGLVESPYIAK